MYNSQPYSFMNNYAFMSKGNEPITVTGLDGAKAYPTMQIRVSTFLGKWAVGLLGLVPAHRRCLLETK